MGWKFVDSVNKGISLITENHVDYGVGLDHPLKFVKMFWIKANPFQTHSIARFRSRQKIEEKIEKRKRKIKTSICYFLGMRSLFSKL